LKLFQKGNGQKAIQEYNSGRDTKSLLAFLGKHCQPPVQNVKNSKASLVVFLREHPLAMLAFLPPAVKDTQVAVARFVARFTEVATKNRQAYWFALVEPPVDVNGGVTELQIPRSRETWPLPAAPVLVVSKQYDGRRNYVRFCHVNRYLHLLSITHSSFLRFTLPERLVAYDGPMLDIGTAQ
jgi:hypothetical protein